jgi:predicted O-methyltransferase YrrM
MAAMSSSTLGRPDHVHAYIERLGYHEPPLLARLRQETARHPRAQMQIAPEQGALLALLVELIGARRCLEIGTFTGYSSLAMALALPADGSVVCCDISDEYTSVARRYWAEAGVAERMDLRIGPAVGTLDALLAAGAAGTFDLAFIDADKGGYPAYWARCLELVRPGGVIAIDNVLRGGSVADPAVDDPDVEAIRETNELVAAEPRVRHLLLGISDGMTIARKR